MLQAVAHDGPRVTLAAFGGVAALVLLLASRRRGAVLILGVLALGVLWMAGAAAGAGVRVNFLNFIALPITFGIGVDYGVNLYLRYRHEQRVDTAVSATGGAVSLCSLTTIIGYAALLAADNHALRSFGALAILGELACLSAALLVLPAVLLLLERRRAVPARPLEHCEARR
jgi:predicted RND superfamily exporter protein